MVLLNFDQNKKSGYILIFFLVSKKMAREALRIDFRKKRYGVARWQYEKLDCIDLYMEMLILINCRFIGTCRPCTSLLKWVFDTLNRKWDNI